MIIDDNYIKLLKPLLCWAHKSTFMKQLPIDVETNWMKLILPLNILYQNRGIIY